MSRVRWNAGTFAMAAVGAVVGVVFAAFGVGGKESPPSPNLEKVSQTKTFAEENSGDDGALSPAHKLVPVLTIRNEQGYVWEDELDLASGGAVSNPDEAKAWMDHLDDLLNQGVTEILIPAYKADGTTVMGQYAISISPSNPVSDITDEELREVFADDPQLLEELLAMND